MFGGGGGDDNRKSARGVGESTVVAIFFSIIAINNPNIYPI